MPGPQFHETREGQTFYGRDVPKFVRAVERIATALERIAEQSENNAKAKAVSRRDFIRILSLAMEEEKENQNSGGHESC